MISHLTKKQLLKKLIFQETKYLNQDYSLVLLLLKKINFGNSYQKKNI